MLTGKLKVAKASLKAQLIGLPLLALLILVLGARAQTSASNSPANEANWEARVRAFLQKRYKIPESSSIKFGPPEPSGFSGLVSRTVTVTGEQGAVAKVTLFTDGRSNKIILGQVLNLEEDPWAKVDTSGLALDDRPTLGPPNAPVTIIEFVDF